MQKQQSKLEFSKQHLALLGNADVWNTKRELVDTVAEKLSAALTELKRNHQAVFEKFVPPASCNGKITRGENHHGFPYVLLDYPNHFSKDEIIAGRNLVWFGNGFHCTLHLKGELVNNVIKNLTQPPGRLENVFICTSTNEWIHHINNNDWHRVEAIDESLKAKIESQRWIKLGIELPIAQPDDWTDGLVAVYKSWGAILSTSP